MQCAAGTCRSVIPDPVYQRFRGHQPSGVYRERGCQQPLLRWSDLDHLAGGMNFNRAYQAKLHFGPKWIFMLAQKGSSPSN